jgi:acetyl esterase/lipase
MRKTPKGLTLLAVLALTVISPQLSEAQARIESDVVYGMYSGLALLMDVHHPANPNGYGIVVIPGSGYHEPLSRDAAPRKEAQDLVLFIGADVLLERGYTLFSINHRAAPTFHYPAAVEDAQRAVRYVRHNASEFGIDGAKIGALGHSSGGYLVSMLGVLDGEGSAEAQSPIDRESAKVQAVVAMAPPTDFLAFITAERSDKAAVTSFLGTYIASFRPREAQTQEYALYTEASPTSYASPDDPPFLFIHGDQDFTVPVNQSELLRDRLRDSGATAEFIKIPEGGHIFQTPQAGGPDTAEYYDEMVGWFDRHLRGAP